MQKRQQLFDPESCLNKAKADELIFVIRAKDPLAIATVKLWIEMAGEFHEKSKVTEAKEWLIAAERWQKANAEPMVEAPVRKD